MFLCRSSERFDLMGGMKLGFDGGVVQMFRGRIRDTTAFGDESRHDFGI